MRDLRRGSIVYECNSEKLERVETFFFCRAAASFNKAVKSLAVLAGTPLSVAKRRPLPRRYVSIVQ